MSNDTIFKGLFECIEHAAAVCILDRDPTIQCCLGEVREALFTPASRPEAKSHLEALLCGQHSEPKMHLFRAMLWVLTGLRNGNAVLPDQMVKKRCQDAVQLTEREWQQNHLTKTVTVNLQAA